jgi:transposase
MTTRKKYSKEFKLDAVRLIKDQSYKPSEAARSLGINANMLGRWVKELESDDRQAFRGNGKLTPEQERIRNLEAEVKLLKMEKVTKRIAQFKYPLQWLHRCTHYGCKGYFKTAYPMFRKTNQNNRERLANDTGLGLV